MSLLCLETRIDANLLVVCRHLTVNVTRTSFCLYLFAVSRKLSWQASLYMCLCSYIWFACMYLYMYVCMHVWMDGWMDVWVDGWMDACMY